MRDNNARSIPKIFKSGRGSESLCGPLYSQLNSSIRQKIVREFAFGCCRVTGKCAYEPYFNHGSGHRDLASGFLMSIHARCDRLMARLTCCSAKQKNASNRSNACKCEPAL